MPTYQARKRPASGKAANEKRNQRAFVLARELMATEAALAATSNGVGDEAALPAGHSTLNDNDTTDRMETDEQQEVTPRHSLGADGSDSDEESFAWFGREDDDEDEEEYQPDDGGAWLWEEDTVMSSEEEPERREPIDDSSTDPSSPSIVSFDDPEDDPPNIHHEDVDFSDREIASLQLLSLCDRSGARRGLFDDILSLLRSFQKKNVDITKAKSRDPFLKMLAKKVKAPKPMTSFVGGRPVVHFSFRDSLQDLLRSSTFDKVDNLCVNKDNDERFQQPFEATTKEDVGEVSAKRWARETVESIPNFDSEKDLLLGLMMYGDKTGVDVNQRYPLEPMMFTLILLRRSAREDSDNWRHLGFLPAVDLLGGSLSPEEKLQLYHDYLAILLQDVKAFAEATPTMWVNLGGVWEKKRLHVKVCCVNGDQKSQDNLVGRKAINGGVAGRIHRGCGSSALCLYGALNAKGYLSKSCSEPPTQEMKTLNALALVDVGDQGELIRHIRELNLGSKEESVLVPYVRRVKKLSKAILGRVFSMHPVRNAFDGIDFGANQHGILTATTEDHMHSCESGSMLHVAEVAYGGLTPSERVEIEQIIRRKVLSSKSSASSDRPYPRGTVRSGFAKLTLCSHTEKVAFVYYLLLALHDRRGRELFEIAHNRQKKKYETFPTKKDVKAINARSKKKSASGSKDRTSTGAVTDSDSEDEDVPGVAEQQEDGNAEDSEPLPESAFPYRDALLYGTDHNANSPFDWTDESIEFVCHHLHRHGLGFLFDLELDRYQLELLMTVSWGILRPTRTKPLNKYPSDATFDRLSELPGLNDIGLEFPPPEEDDEDDDDQDETSLSKRTKALIPRKLPPRKINLKALPLEEDEEDSAEWEAMFKLPSLPIDGCVAKHRRKKPIVKGNGNTGAILSDMATFLSYVELVLTYHAWCHYSSDLPMEMQVDRPLIQYSRSMVVQYTDALIYRGDDTVDSATGKLHTQLHDTSDSIGDPMGHNSATGERGLKDWAKGAGRTALKHGDAKFTQSTSDRVGERLLVKRSMDLVSRKETSPDGPPSPPKETRRMVPHFSFNRRASTSSDDRLVSFDRNGKSQPPNATTGTIQARILTAINDVEVVSNGSGQEVVDIWCEANLPCGQPIKCFPQYRRKEGPRYDWAICRFRDGQPDPAKQLHPAKVLALYEDIHGQFKALVHATEYKLTRNPEGPFGDSRLVTHYRLQFQNNGEPLLYSIPFKT